jgi:hypothetical protein
MAAGYPSFYRRDYLNAIFQASKGITTVSFRDRYSERQVRLSFPYSVARRAAAWAAAAASEILVFRKVTICHFASFTPEAEILWMSGQRPAIDTPSRREPQIRFREVNRPARVCRNKTFVQRMHAEVWSEAI